MLRVQVSLRVFARRCSIPALCFCLLHKFEGKKEMNLKLRVALTVFMLMCVANSYAETRKLRQAQAVKLAEEFIVRNGYTDLPPDKEHLAFESLERGSNVDEILQARHNTLERKAYGIARGRKSGSPSWIVVFRYKYPSYPEMRRNGRAVTMNLDGSNMRVEHQDFILRAVDKRL
jgi:hypothetical protein